MRVGLVFLAGLLAGGLAVAWLVAEMPAGLPATAAPAPSVPAIPAPGEAVIPAITRASLPAPSPDRDMPMRPMATGRPPAAASLPEPRPVPLPGPGPGEEVAASAGQGEGAGPGRPRLPALEIPVDGVAAEALLDTFADARGEDRVHEALDIMAPEGTPVRAVADGPVVKLFDSVPGGLTLYQFDEAGQVAFYYAHMQRYAEGIVEGRQLQQGDVLGYVGHTGNASAEAPHLHFAIFVLGPEKNWWEGEAINPYPLLAPPAP